MFNHLRINSKAEYEGISKGCVSLHVGRRIGVRDAREKLGSVAHGSTAAAADLSESAAPWYATHGARRPGSALAQRADMPIAIPVLQ